MGCCDSKEDDHSVNMGRTNKGAGFGKGYDNGLEISEQSLAQVQKEMGDDYWSSYSDLESADESNAGDLDSSNITLSRRGPTKNLFRKSVMDKIVSYCSDSVREIYKERGPF
jgi:t-SNARE complex subunit (syntaxin)